jgi:Histidine kinase
MRLHDFIFSEKTSKRLQRHLIFWLAWWLYFSLCDYLYQQPIPSLVVRPVFINVGSNLLIKIFFLFTIYVIACYTVLYFLRPLIIKNRSISAVLMIIPLAFFMYGAAYILFWNVFPFIDSLLGSSAVKNSGTLFWPAIFLGLIAPLKIIVAAIAIKWWLKQKESEKLEREKVNAELQLLKAQVHPDFLFKTLNNIYSHSLSSSPQTPGMLLKLSDLLSYMLYDCDRPEVCLRKEIDMMKEYMQLEKIRHNDKPEMEVNIKGDMNGKQIAPFLLLPFIENSFKYSCQVTEQSWINMDIKIDGNNFSMKLTNGIAETLTDYPFSANGLSNVQKRLKLLYPGKHELKITAEQEMLIVLLNIRLDSDLLKVPEEQESAIHEIEKESTELI